MHPLSPPQYSHDEQDTLLDLARKSIHYHFDNKAYLPIHAEDYSKNLQKRRACFVTLRKQQVLRGCIGGLEANQALVYEVVERACDAAFHDPRFYPVKREEFAQLHIHISVLGQLHQMEISDRKELLQQIRPHYDGLVVEDGTNRGTFLPAVWEALPDPEKFVEQLMCKADLPPDHWSPNIRVYRYNCTSFGD